MEVTEDEFDGIAGFALFLDALEGRDTDLTLQVGPDSALIPAHSALLKRMSPVFEAMLNDTWKRGEKLALPEDDPEDFRMFLKLLYGYKIWKSEDFANIFPVVILADKYQATHVQQVLSKFVRGFTSNNLRIGNVVPIYLSANELDGMDLKDLKHVKKTALDFILKNINDLWKGRQWLKLDEEAVIWILSQKTLFHTDAENTAERGIVLEHHCVCGRKCYFSNSRNLMQKCCGSKNETLIFGKVIEWLQHQKRSNVEGTTGEDNVAMRVLKQIRFCEIGDKDFVQVVQQLTKFLTRTDIADIVLVRCFIGSGTSNCVPIVEPRVLPDVPETCFTSNLGFWMFRR